MLLRRHQARGPLPLPLPPPRAVAPPHLPRRHPLVPRAPAQHGPLQEGPQESHRHAAAARRRAPAASRGSADAGRPAAAVARPRQGRGHRRGGPGWRRVRIGRSSGSSAAAGCVGQRLCRGLLLLRGRPDARPGRHARWVHWGRRHARRVHWGRRHARRVHRAGGSLRRPDRRQRRPLPRRPSPATVGALGLPRPAAVSCAPPPRVIAPLAFVGRAP